MADYLEPSIVSGRKDDNGKAPWHLFPWDAARQIVAVLQFGAGKYGERNWETGIAYSRCYSALIRHLTAWWEREPCDKETGLSHLAHAGCCLVFLLAYEVRGMVQFDDRPGSKRPLAQMLRDLKRMHETDTLMDSDFDLAIAELEGACVEAEEKSNGR